MINDHHGGRRPSFLGRWSGRAIGLLCFGYLAQLPFHHLVH